ncbi:zinc finger protein [Anaeramoeba flamelloides]|uniref:Zinc finger protein n=1 Tax=Anaeramoeba flamelloides TaxID=1746091 RepID=A0ABQ8YNY8_9EUKA|nr:zinc finger protein [Anaeramoeba flamelloides]
MSHFDPFKKGEPQQNQTKTAFDPFQNKSTEKTTEEKEKKKESFDPFNTTKTKNKEKKDKNEKTKTTFDPFQNKTTKERENEEEEKEKKKTNKEMESKFLRKIDNEEDELTKQMKKKERRRKGHHRIDSSSSSEYENGLIQKDLLEKKKQKEKEQEFDYFKKHEEDLDKFVKGGEDLMGLGVHCASKICHKLDFLPFTCDLCKQKFCQEHWQAEDHDCKFMNRSEKRIYICPICNNELQVEKGQDPNRIVDRHISSKCKIGIRKSGSRIVNVNTQNQNRTRNRNRNQKSNRNKNRNKRNQNHHHQRSNVQSGQTIMYTCSEKGCKQKEKIQIKCTDCGLNFCLKHRNPITHNCQGKQKKTSRKKRVNTKNNKKNQNSQKKKQSKRKFNLKFWKKKKK